MGGKHLGLPCSPRLLWFSQSWEFGEQGPQQGGGVQYRTGVLQLKLCRGQGQIGVQRQRRRPRERKRDSGEVRW